jgi:hypothetical protein
VIAAQHTAGRDGTNSVQQHMQAHRRERWASWRTAVSLCKQRDGTAVVAVLQKYITVGAMFLFIWWSVRSYPHAQAACADIEWEIAAIACRCL